jgi:hypothetical protein
MGARWLGLGRHGRSFVPLNARSIGLQHSTVLPTHGDEIITHWAFRLSNLPGRTLISCG